MTLYHSLNLSLNKICDVLIEDLPIKKEDYPIYSYIIPEKLIGKASIGKRVFVPFGKGNKLKKGLIVKIWEGEGKNLKEIIDFVSDYKIVDEGGLKVLFKLKEKYFIPISSILKKVLPLGKSRKGEEIIKLIDSEYEKNISPKEKRKLELIEFLIESGGEIKLSILRKFFTSKVINDLIRRGIILKTYELQKEKRKERESSFDIKIGKEKEILIQKNTILYGYTYKERWSYYVDLIKSYINLNERIKIIFPQKNEIYEFLKILPEDIKKLTRKITGEENKNERESLFEDINEEKVKVLLGTTIALLLPLNEKVLIIDGEEKFKSLEDILNLKILDISKTYIEEKDKKLLIGTFYPSFELLIMSKKSFFQVLKKRLSLKNVEILYREQERIISSYLKNVINKNRDKKIFVFYPRKGYYQYLFCDECGYTAKCPKCKIPLTYFKDSNKLICKICGYEKFPFDICPQCGGFTMRFSSPGVERIKERFKKIFPDKIIYQLDDWITKGSQKKREEIENEFLHFGNIIIGTHLILPLIKKIQKFIFIFLDIDFMLNFPDYDSFEKLFYLILGVIEDSISNNGKVYIQTRFPKLPLFKSIKEKNLNLFVNEELKRRKETKFPPYYKYITIENVNEELYNEFYNLKDNDDEIYFSEKTLKIKTKNFFKFGKIFDKIKYDRVIRIKEF